MSDQDLFDARRIDARAGERRLDGNRAEFCGMGVAERAAVAANRGPGRAYDDDFRRVHPTIIAGVALARGEGPAERRERRLPLARQL